MKFIKILTMFLAISFLLTGCNVKISLNSNLNQSEIKIEENANKNVNQPVANINEPAPEKTEVVPDSLELAFDATPENMLTAIKNKKTGEVLISDLKALCQIEVMLFAQPNEKIIIVKPFNPGSDKPNTTLLSINVAEKKCQELAISKELGDFGSLVLSPDQSKITLALETNEAKVLKLLDLVNDQVKVLVDLPADETLNGGYGALANHFDIKWLDDQKIQYSVYEDTIKNYPSEIPDKAEKVLQVRVIKIE